jgi:hypothetical protein
VKVLEQTLPTAVAIILDATSKFANHCAAKLPLRYEI